MNFFTNYPIDIKYNKITKTSKFKNADYKKKTHNLTTKIFGSYMAQKKNGIKQLKVLPKISLPKSQKTNKVFGSH